MTRTLRITATLFAALLLTTGTQVASASQRLAAATLVPNVTPTATLTVAPTQTTAPVGALIDLSGSLDLSDGASLTGHTIHVLETAPGGVETDVGTASTDIFGHFYFAVPNALTPAGHWTFRATFDGGSTYLPTDASTGVDVGNPPPSLTLGTSAATILIGGHVTVTATLGAWHSNDQVSIYGTTGGGPKQLVGSGAVNSSGIFAVSLSPTHNTVYSASWAGDDTYLPATSASKAVSVRAKLAIAQAGYYRSSHGVRLYHYRASCWTRSTHCPRFTAGLLPSMAGKGILFTLQRRSSGHWRTVTTGTIATNVNGLAAAIYRYRGTVLIGKTMRVKASWAGDSGNLGAHSKWTLFRLTS
jgi:hypothetical protein